MMKGQKGFSLIELMTGLGIFSLLVLIASMLTSWAVYRYFSVRDRILAEATAYQAETSFRDFFGQAMDIGFTVGVVPQDLPPSTGAIHHTAVNVADNSANFLFDQMADTPDWVRIATFYREQSSGMGLNAATAVQGDPRATGVFYRRPSATTSGVIFFDVSSAANSVAAMTPGYNDVFIDRISTFGITKRRHPHHDKTTSIEVLVRIRYHTFAGRRSTWCPRADIAANVGGCNNGAAFRDHERRFNVLLANNLMKGSGFLHSTVNAEERTLGNLYFFRLVNPAR